MKKSSERRSEHLLNDLLISQGWDLRQPPYGQLLFQHEYRSYPELVEVLAHASKSGEGAGVPEAILVDKSSIEPLAVIEAKPKTSQLELALNEAQDYAEAFINEEGYSPLAVGLAGSSDAEFALQVSKWDGSKWKVITYDGNPINWIPTRVDVELLATPQTPPEIRPSIPPAEILAERADEINRLLREANVIDQQRPAVVGAIMLALWSSRGELRRDKKYILQDINDACQDAFIKSGKPELAKSLRVDVANEKLAEKARRITTILERLNVAVLTAEHDYLGQLYETFFRYTGGNTIGQYFTPRHIAQLMVDICQISKNDVVLDPACGSGGFLVASMDRILHKHKLSRTQLVALVKKQLIGFENEPVTAALCVANMILRGDGSTGVHRDDCFTAPTFPINQATVALMNPPFPHKQTDTPAEQFVDRALEGLRKGGKLAVILPTSILVKKDKGTWREKVLRNNSLLAVCQLPDELFQPFASATTTFVILEKGTPHNPQRKTVFVRLHHDGLTLKKGVRVERSTEPNQIPDAIEAILNKTSKPGFAGQSSVEGEDEWAPGAYIPSAPPAEDEVKKAVDVLLRRLGSFYARYAAEVVNQRRLIRDKELIVSPYRDIISKKRLANAELASSIPGTIGDLFDIYYGMKELHSREGYAPGPSLIISPTEGYNGCYGWLEFQNLSEAPFVTVAQTGSIGEAFVQFEPCAVNDDCLILLPKKNKKVSEAMLVLAAATLHAEKWRFTYGRKLTPSRINSFKLPQLKSLEYWVENKLKVTRKVIKTTLEPYETD